MGAARVKPAAGTLTVSGLRPMTMGFIKLSEAMDLSKVVISAFSQMKRIKMDEQ